ncbi:uncharacterized protein Triagg1_7799 [Trichoderma aggressivum f. europaeum]|uniref:RRM domain-containing protein n=1 Tax=Trichoderma aggressivum f. europaeum TaxID=173218 RepID=A0AAE1I926_9HYPO|nr:hypothetical protein Triagg1_7799 [Trichoderma aggressivum f. europaeum]
MLSRASIMAENIKMNLQPAPHSVLYAPGFPRVHAENYPHGDRAAFAKYYPYGIPVTYKMMHGVHSQGVAQTYLEDHLPVGFYTNVPAKARAFISTSNGSRPFRKLDHILPQRRIHLWSKDEIQGICNSLRKVFWNELKNMQQPHCWDDLWTFFDAHDLYHNGCMNLWNVVNTLWDENTLISVDVRREVAAHIGHWADEWLKREQNQDKLAKWQESHGPIFRILDDQDHDSLGLIHDDVVPLIASALRGRRSFLLSNKEKKQAEEPADLMTACRTNSIENWLTGQRVFDNNGLPPPPLSEPHRGSSVPNMPAPCIVENGKHYFLPQHCFPLMESPSGPIQALQALQKSAEAAVPSRQSTKSGVVIVNGSNLPKQLQSSINKAEKKKASEFQDQSDPRRIASMPETSSPAALGSGLDSKHNTVLPASGNGDASVTEARRSSESASLSTSNKISSDHPLPSEKAGGESTVNKLIREVAELEHNKQDTSVDQPFDKRYSGNVRQLESRIHPESEGQFPLHEAARLENNQVYGTDGPFNDPTIMTRQWHSSQRFHRLPQDQRHPIGNSPDDFTRQNLAAPVKASPEPTPFYMQPEKAFIPHPSSKNGFPNQSGHFYATANRPVPHSTPYRDISGSSQVMPLQQLVNGTHSGAVAASKLCSTATNGSDASVQLAQSTRSEMLHGSSTSSMHNDYGNDSQPYNKVGQRRGSSAQKTHGWNSGQQAHLDHHPTPREPYLNKSWRRSAQPDRTRQASWCLNPGGSHGVEYTHCPCSGCNERNRSIWVRVFHDTFAPNIDVQTTLKFGIGSRFGQVEEVYPAPSQNKDAFIVRFAKEPSVPQALAFGAGTLAEKGIRIIIRPAHRSKWVNNHQHQQTRRLPPLPITHQQPAWDASTPSSMNVGNAHPAGPGPSSSATPTRTPERGQIANSSSCKGTEILPCEIGSDPTVAQETTLPVETASRPGTDQPREALQSTDNRGRATSVKDEEPYEPEQASTRAALSVQTKKAKKKETVSQSKPLPQAYAGGEDSKCSEKVLGGEDGRRSLSKKARVALPSSPVMLAGASVEECKASSSAAPHSDTGDGSSTPKDQQGQAKETHTSEQVGIPCPTNTSTTETGVKNDAKTEKDQPSVSSHFKKAQNSVPKVGADLSPTTKISENIFTEDEIRERKQAWIRIPMPLDLRKSKKLGTSVTSGQPPMSQKTQKEVSNDVMKNTRVPASCVDERAQLEASNISGVDKITLDESVERVEESTEAVEDVVQKLVKDEGSNLEQRLCAPNEQPRIALRNEDSSSSSKLEPSESIHRAPEQLVEDTLTTPGMVLTTDDGKASTEANNQSKPKTKWNKNKKAKKRLASALQADLQKETGSQEVSPSDLGTSAVPAKEKLQTSHDTLIPSSATAGPTSHSLQFSEKIDELSTEPLGGPREQTMTGNRTQYPYDTLPRGRLDFRSNAGGSLKIPKKRKNKYPSITSKTFEASTTGRLVSTQSRDAAGGPTPTTDIKGAIATSSVTPAGEADASKKSRLNPLATAFVSPRKPTTTGASTEAVSYSPRAASSRAGLAEVSLEKMQPPSKFKIMRRPATTNNSPSKAPQLREKLNQGPKGADGFESPTKQQENNRNEIQRDWSKDKHQRERENVRLTNSNTTSPPKDGGKKNVGLDTQDWPALPVSRVRSATLE